jgi:glutaminyl-peptide cyclotransferase
MAYGPRYAGHRGHARTLAWLREQLGFRADTVLTQPFTHRTAAGDTLRMTNVIARYRPEAPDRILLVAHWDTRRRADRSPFPEDRSRPVQGANDGASGTAVLMELAELFRQQPPPIGVDLLFTDGEDFGPGPEDMYLGARHFAANPLPGPRPRYAIVLDMVADADARFRPEENSLRFAPDVARRVWALAKVMGHDSVFQEERAAAISDDHVELAKAGIPSIVIIDYEYGPGNQFWHSVDDVIKQVSRETMGIVGEVVAEHVYRGFPKAPGEK